jgi:uncharacterized protein YneF (UPF0154 family)
MAYTVKEVADYIAANPQLSYEDLVALAQSNGVSDEVLSQARDIVNPITTMPVDGTVTDYTPGQYTPGKITDQQLQQFFAANPNISNEQTYALMQQYQVSPQQVVNAMGLDPQTAYGQFNQQVVNNARPGQVTDYELQAYFANNPNTPDSQVFALMQQYGVSPEQVSRAIGMPLDQAQSRYRTAQAEAIPTGVLGSEQALGQGLTDATATLRGAETSSRSDIDAALARINQLYGINIDDLRAAGTQASSQINTGFDEARGYFQPFQQGGTTAFNQQLALSGALGRDAFNAARQESPYEQFLFEQGMRGNLAGAAATGGLGGGNVQRELTRFGQGLASQGLQQQIGNLNQLSGMGMQGSQALSGLATGRAGALGDITLNTAGNIVGQRGAMAGYEGQAGIGRANIGQQTGRGIAEMQYGTGQDLAAGRTRVGEIQANQLQQAAANQSLLLEGLGLYQSNLIGGQANNLIDLQNQAAVNAANQATGLASGISGLQTGLAAGQNAAFQGAARIPSQSFDYGQAFNAAAGGYNLGSGMVNQTRAGGLAPVSTSQPINYGMAPPRSIDAYQNTTNRRLQGLT